MKKKMCSLLLVLCLCITLLLPSPALAAGNSGSCGNDVQWSFSGGKLTISGSGAMYNYSKTSDVPWNGKEINSVVVNNGVTSIGDGAFENCTSVTRIVYAGFSSSASLNNITLPASVTSIGKRAFSGCTKVTSVILPDNVTTIGASAFNGCTSLTGISLPNGATNIGSGAFSGCTSLTGITLPEGVTKLSDNVFNGCASLTNVAIPNSVTGIGAGAFSGCTSVANIVYRGFKNATNLTGVTLTLPDNVTSIGANAFSDCTGLRTVTLPKGVTSIAEGTFSRCVKLTSVALPKNVTSIGKRAFYNCTSVANVVYHAFENATSLTGITLPSSVKSIGEGAFSRCTGLRNVDLPKGVTSVVYHAFSDCTNLRSVTIPDSVNSIGNGVFSGCTSLPRIDVEKGNTSYRSEEGVLMNRDATKLVGYPAGKRGSYIVPTSVTGIESEAFSGCTNLTAVAVLEKVTSIGNGAFSGCDGLTIYGYRNTKAASYARTNAITFVPLDFVDLEKGKFYYTPVLWAVMNNIAGGVSDTEFAPYQDCSRGQVVSFLWRAMGSPEPRGNTNPFADVKSTRYYYKAVLWAAENNITSGVDAKNFAPNKTVTRAEFVTFLWRALGKPGNSGVNPFTDIPKGKFYTDAVLWAAENGITTGSSQGKFSPNDVCTRGQVVTFLYRAFAE